MNFLRIIKFHQVKNKDKVQFEIKMIQKEYRYWIKIKLLNVLVKFTLYGNTQTIKNKGLLVHVA